ncbi:adenosylcobinamide-phosphate synthase CbiB [Terriglobus albidus]|uniref:adenosylcobinamide-phosphate synthase CbiB n=1 Tax=Terriglobus albidus TaxID=1592106 RepID=UPI0021DF9F70|nr:adenosylcobinamide-phosphate synthase CbiB [Terriglobus albidus]
MNRATLLISTYLADQLAGDPEWFPHPVRLIGSAISRGEAALRCRDQSARSELINGAVLTIAIVGSTYWLTAALPRIVRRRSARLGEVVELLLGWTCLAARNLEQEARAVTQALDANNLPLARKRLSRIVGRDTEHLNPEEISRAVIETVAESASDGIMAPLFYMALGGVPLAMAYKSINTLDSMIGHADDRYFYFGKFAARCDDAANFLPSRLCALSIIGAAQLVKGAEASSAWDTWRRDNTKHKSPNAGQPESAMAGALHVALGGDNTYAGELIRGQRIGDEFAAPDSRKVVQAIRIVSVATVIGLGLGLFITALRKPRRRD